jgi:hypothetical protein
MMKFIIVFSLFTIGFILNYESDRKHSDPSIPISGIFILSSIAIAYK